MATGRNLVSYLKEAFVAKWNLLFFLGAFAAAVLSPWPDAILPLIAAGELAYLVGMVSRPQFRTAVDAKEHKARTKAKATKRVPPVSLAQLVNALPVAAEKRFSSLRSHCLEMSRIAAGARGQTGDSNRADDLRTPALDRLLWVFLRLLVAQHALDRFITSTDEAELTQKLSDVKRRLETIEDGGDERIRASLVDSVAVAELRLSNYLKARGNADFVELELDRIEAKIQALVEMSVNRQDPDYLTDQVDAAADSMKQTESAISELQSITGLTDVLEEPPPILESDLRGTIGTEA